MNNWLSKRLGPLGAAGRGQRPLRLGHWLVLLVVGFFLGPLCISNLWGYLQSRGYLTEAAFRNIRNVAALEASETLEFVTTAESLVSSIVAGNQHLFGLLRTFAESGDSEVRASLARQIQKHLAAKASEDSSVEEFQVISQLGVPIASSGLGPVAEGSGTLSNRCFQNGRVGPRVVGFDYDRAERGSRDSHGQEDAGSENDREPDLLVATPIEDGAGLFLGVFCARFGFEIHRSLLVARKERTSHAALFLLDGDGRIICGSFEDSHGAPYGERLLSLKETRPVPGKAWEGRYRVDSGHEMMVAYAPIPSLGWGVAVEVPVEQALADLERLKWQAVGASSLLAVVLALAGFVSWRTVVRPLQALASTSDRIASGEPGETVSPGGPREVVELATAFNRMSLALRDSQELLEWRIGERTRELRESREFAELLLDSIDQRVVVVNANFEIIRANAAAVRMHGSPLVGAKCHESFEGLADPPESYPARRTFETSCPASGERSQQTVRGQEAVYVETYPVLDAEGRVESVIELGRVVTAEKRLQMQIVYQEKMAAFGQLAAGLAHEIGNPLAAIESQLRLAQDDPSRVEKTLEVVRRQVRRMDRMLRELVDFTRRRRDEVTLASANQVVEDVARLLEHDPRARTLSIELRLADNLPGVRTKEDTLVQVLLNLGLNALDAAGEAGKIEFETGLDNEQVTIRVRDSGKGVPKLAQAHLFEPFFTTKGPGHGTGLGLFVSKGIVEGMGGLLELEETGPDGTTFVLRLRVDGSRPGGRARD